MSSVKSENIVYEISLSAEAQSNVAETEKKVQDIKAIIEQLEKEIQEIQKPTDKKSEDKSTEKKETEKPKDNKEHESLSEGEKFIKTIDSKGLSNLKSLSNNPASLMEGQFLSFLTKGGPQTAIIAAMISAAVSSPETLAQVVKALAAPGGPLNRDWKRFIEKQVDIGLTRFQIERRQVGADILVIPQRLGFVPSNEVWASNSLFAIDAKKVARIGLSDKEEGLFY